MGAGPPPDVLTLIGSQKAEFNHAARLRTYVVRVQMLIGALGALSVFVDGGTWLYVLALAALLAAGTWLYLANELSASRAHAERLRRATLISGGLGVQLDGSERFELANGGKASKAESKRLIDPDYFASKSPSGIARFVEMLEESALWTANLAGFAAKETWLVFGGSVVVTVMALFSGVMFVPLHWWEMAARVLFAMLVVVLSVDFLGAARSYAESKSAILRIVDRLQPYKGGGGSLERLMVIFADYNSVVEAMPLFSQGLYPRHERELNEQYKMYLTGPQ